MFRFEFAHRQFLIVNIVPVEVLEPAMPFDVVRSVLHVAHSLRAIGNEQLLDQILSDRIHVPRPVDLAAQDFLVDAKRIVVVEWRIADEHFVDEDAYKIWTFLVNI